MKDYLAGLMMRLFAGVSRLPARRRDELRHYFLSRHLPSGGFAGKHGDADVYYSAFGLRGLFLLHALDDRELLEKNLRFLESQRKRISSAAEWTSLIFCKVLLHLAQGRESSEDDREQVKTILQRFLRPDGGFAGSEKSAYSSTYQTFLSATAFEMMGLEEEKQAIPVDTILCRQRPDGGFVELEKLHRSGTNPTAAAVALLKMRGAAPKNSEAAIAFLLDRQSASGGFQANTMIPLPDLLSSFTALVALADLEAEQRCDRRRLRQFVEEMKASDGGFFGGDWDRQSDVEYTFYGMGLEALLVDLRSAAK